MDWEVHDKTSAVIPLRNSWDMFSDTKHCAQKNENRQPQPRPRPLQKSGLRLSRTGKEYGLAKPTSTAIPCLFQLHSKALCEGKCLFRSNDMRNLLTKTTFRFSESVLLARRSSRSLAKVRLSPRPNSLAFYATGKNDPWSEGLTTYE